MDDSSESQRRQSDANAWASPVSTFNVHNIPAGAVNINVEGRAITSPVRGFGQLWQKTYRVRLAGSQASPKEVIRLWKENFPKFWPQGNYFYRPSSDLRPGDVAVLNLAAPGGSNLPGGLPVISTGVMVLYADDESFTFTTPEGHMFAGWITFSAYEEDGCTVAQARALVRASDPIYEIGMRWMGRKEDEFWEYTLTQLARFFGVSGQVKTEVSVLDPKVQWQEARSIWNNAGVRTFFYALGAPLRWITRRGKPVTGGR